jgi:hypothetical protein
MGFFLFLTERLAKPILVRLWYSKLRLFDKFSQNFNKKIKKELTITKKYKKSNSNGRQSTFLNFETYFTRFL